MVNVKFSENASYNMINNYHQFKYNIGGRVEMWIRSLS